MSPLPLNGSSKSESLDLWEVNVAKSGSNDNQSASERIDELIAELGDWRTETLSRMRKLVKEFEDGLSEKHRKAEAERPARAAKQDVGGR